MGDYSQEYKVSKQLCPMDIQMESSSEKLKEYLDKQVNPSEQLKTYLNARIEASEHFEKLKNNKSHNKGSEPELYDQDGKKILNLGVQPNQTSNNGCWSVSLSMMLRSRGVDLPQEVIRAYRNPDVGNDSDTKTNYTEDNGAQIGERANLIADVLPNTLLRTRSYQFGETTNNGYVLSDDKDLGVLADQLYEDVKSAIMDKKTPVSLYIAGHTRTAIGVDTNNKTILFKDSMEDPRDATFSCTAIDMFKIAKNRVTDKNSKMAIEIGWLEDIKQDEGVKFGENVIKYQKKNDESYTLLADAYSLPFGDDKGNVLNSTAPVHTDQTNHVYVSESVYLPKELVQIKPYKKIDPPKVAGNMQERAWDKDHKEHDIGTRITDMPKMEPEKKPEEKKEEVKPEEKEEEKKPEEKKEEEKKPEKQGTVEQTKQEPEIKEPTKLNLEITEQDILDPEEMEQFFNQQSDPKQQENPQQNATVQEPQEPGAQMPQAQMPLKNNANPKASDADSTLAMRKKELEKLILSKPESPGRPSLWDYIKDWFGIGGKRNEKCVQWEAYKKGLKQWQTSIKKQGAQLQDDEMKEMVRKGMQQGNYVSQMQETQKEGPTLSSYMGIQNSSKVEAVPTETPTTTPLVSVQQKETKKEPLPDEKELKEQSKKEVEELLKKLKEVHGEELPEQVVQNVNALSDGARQGQLRIQEQIREHENISDQKQRYFSVGEDFPKIIAYESFKKAVMDGKANKTLLDQMTKDKSFHVAWQAAAYASDDVQYYIGAGHTPDDYRKALSKPGREKMADELNQGLVKKAKLYGKENALCRSAFCDLRP